MGTKLAEHLTRMRQISDVDANKMRESIRQTHKLVQALAASPPRQPKKPSHGTCRYCGANVMWAQTENFKNIPLDTDSKGGSWVIKGDFAVQVEGFDEEGHTSHHQTCTKKPRK
jgi:hypothetical protein